MEEEKSETTTTTTVTTATTKVAEEEMLPPIIDSNQNQANVSQKSASNNQSATSNNNNSNNTKKNNNRRRKRSFRVRKNSGNFKFNPKRTKQRRNMMYSEDQARKRHQLFFTDSQRLVPYNTNEFLMDDHYPKISPNFNYQPYTHDSFSSSDCGMSGSLDEDEFLTREFRIDYENLRTEQLSEMSKEQLIEEYLKLENQTEMSIKTKENEILALNNKIKELTRRLVTKNGDAGKAESEDSESDSSTSSSSSSSSSCSSSECEMEESNANDEYAAVITEPQPVSC